VKFSEGGVFHPGRGGGAPPKRVKKKILFSVKKRKKPGGVKNRFPKGEGHFDCDTRDGGPLSFTGGGQAGGLFLGNPTRKTPKIQNYSLGKKGGGGEGRHKTLGLPKKKKLNHWGGGRGRARVRIGYFFRGAETKGISVKTKSNRWAGEKNVSPPFFGGGAIWVFVQGPWGGPGPIDALTGTSWGGGGKKKGSMGVGMVQFGRAGGGAEKGGGGEKHQVLNFPRQNRSGRFGGNNSGGACGDSSQWMLGKGTSPLSGREGGGGGHPRWAKTVWGKKGGTGVGALRRGKKNNPPAGFYKKWRTIGSQLMGKILRNWGGGGERWAGKKKHFGRNFHGKKRGKGCPTASKKGAVKGRCGKKQFGATPRLGCGARAAKTHFPKF